MQAGRPRRILHGQLLAVLQAVDAFVLCPVVLKEPADILHHRDGQDIGHKDHDPDQALEQGQQGRQAREPDQGGGQKIGQDHEEAQGQEDADHHDARHEDPLPDGLLFPVLIRSCFDGSRLFCLSAGDRALSLCAAGRDRIFLLTAGAGLVVCRLPGQVRIVLRVDRGRIIRALKTQDHGIDKDKDPPYKRDLFQRGIREKAPVLFLPDRDTAVASAHSDRIILAIAHHDAFQDRLSADPRIVLTAFLHDKK